MSDWKRAAVSAHTLGMNSQSSIITNHISGSYSWMSLKLACAANNGIAEAR
jgi:hypothetical protein